LNESNQTKGETVETAPDRRKTLIEFIKFGIVGVMNTGVDFLVFTLLLWAGMHYLAAQPLSYGAGTLNSYIVNKLWTFRVRSSPSAGSRYKHGIKAEFIRFLLLNLATLLLSITLLYLLKDGLGIQALAAKLLVTAVTVVVNYAGSKLWVFRPK
jgi:putative flippase GtrA